MGKEQAYCFESPHRQAPALILAITIAQFQSGEQYKQIQ